MLTSAGVLGGGAAPRVLDLFAGTGALALEALSRGAAEAMLVEHDRDAVAVIRKNARLLAADSRVRVLEAKVERAVSKLEGSFGIVFLDPPYVEVRSPSFNAVLESAAALVAPAGALVLEHASTDAPPAIASLELDRSRRYGDTSLSLYRHTSQLGDP